MFKFLKEKHMKINKNMFRSIRKGDTLIINNNVERVVATGRNTITTKGEFDKSKPYTMTFDIARRQKFSTSTLKWLEQRSEVFDLLGG